MFYNFLFLIPKKFSVGDCSALSSDYVTFQNAMMSSLPYLVNWVLSLPLSSLADWILSSNRMSVTATRKTFATVACLAPALAFSALAFTGCDSVLVMVLLCVATGAASASSASTGVNQIDLAPNYAGTLMGLTNGAANVMGFVAPMIVGWIVNDSVSQYLKKNQTTTLLQTLEYPLPNLT